MRGIATVRNNEKYTEIYERIDRLVDNVSRDSEHLLLPYTNCLHYLRVLRFIRTDERASYVWQTYSRTQSRSIKRACIDCWRIWGDRTRFQYLRNQWNALSAEELRMLWLAAAQFGDEGRHFRNQVRRTLPNVWRLGIEEGDATAFDSVYRDWAERIDDI